MLVRILGRGFGGSLGCGGVRPCRGRCRRRFDPAISASNRARVPAVRQAEVVSSGELMGYLTGVVIQATGATIRSSNRYHFQVAKVKANVRPPMVYRRLRRQPTAKGRRCRRNDRSNKGMVNRIIRANHPTTGVFVANVTMTGREIRNVSRLVHRRPQRPRRGVPRGQDSSAIARVLNRDLGNDHARLLIDRKEDVSSRSTNRLFSPNFRQDVHHFGRRPGLVCRNFPNRAVRCNRCQGYCLCPEVRRDYHFRRPLTRRGN